jgi:hypothetical protein
MRWAALASGSAMIVVAFAAAFRVADTREGLIYEVITLFAGLFGVILLLYGLLAPSFRGRQATGAPPAPELAMRKVHTANELLLGAGGILVALVLVAGLGLSTGPIWAAFGLAALSPMLAGCVYLCYGFARGPERDWHIDLQRLTGLR